MGRATRLAERLKRSAGGSGYALLEMVTNTNRIYRNGRVAGDQDWPEGMRSPPLTHDGLWGSVVVKDRAENNHRIIYAGTEQTRKLESGRYRHTEESLIDDLIEFLDVSEMQLMSARVIFFIRWSPCIQCTKKIVDWAWDIGTRLTPNGECIVKFVYQQLYTKNNCSYAHTYSSAVAANNAYDDVAGRYTPGGKGGYPEVTIEFMKK